MFGRERLAFHAGVEAEDAGLVVAEAVKLGGGGVAPAPGVLAVADRVFAFVDFYGRAAATPAVGRVIFPPKRVIGRQRDAVQFGVFLAHPVVTGGAVLQIVKFSGNFFSKSFQ